MNRQAKLIQKIITASKYGNLIEIQNHVNQCENKNEATELAFIHAAANGHLNVVKHFVENGVNIEAQKNLALAWAGIYGKLGVIKYLVEKGIDIRVENNRMLSNACNSGKIEIIKYCIDEHNYHPETVFDIALKDFCATAVKYLIVKYNCSPEVAINFTRSNVQGVFFNNLIKERDEIINWCEEYLIKKLHKELKKELPNKNISAKKTKI